MTKKQLKHIDVLQKEIELLEMQIKKLEQNADEIVSDIVNDYRSGYAQKTEITGLNRKQLDAIKERAAALRLKKDELQAEMKGIESFINSTDDEVIRLIMRHRFVEGLTWREVGVKVYGKPMEDAPRKRFERFLDRPKKNFL